MTKRLNEQQKIYILSNYKHISLTKIGIKLNKTRQAIYAFIKRCKERGYIANKKRVKTFKLSSLNPEIVKEYLRNNKFTGLNQIKQNFNLNVCINTIRNYLIKNGIKYGSIPTKPQMTSKHMERRLTFANKYKDWTTDDWNKVLFCDECSVVLGKNYKRKGWKSADIFSYERRRKCFSIKYFKVFSFIGYQGQGELMIVEGKWNSDYYINLLKKVILPEIKNKYGNDCYLLQDNDSSHKSKKTMKAMEEIGIKLIDFPLNSSDFNPIENLWSVLKKRLADYKVFEKQRVQEKAKEIWSNIEINIVRNVIFSMEKRLKLVLAKMVISPNIKSFN